MSSRVVGKEITDDYDETSGNVRRFAVRMNHDQPCDPEKLAMVLVTLADAQTPPLRLPLGTDTPKALVNKSVSLPQKPKRGGNYRNRRTFGFDLPAYGTAG